MSVAIIAFGKSLYQKIVDDDCAGLASEMAYNFLIAMIPALIFTISILGLIGQQTTLLPVVEDFIDRISPTHMVDLLNQTIEAVVTGSSKGLTVLGILVSLWTGSNGAMVLLKALHRADGLKQTGQPFWKMRCMALFVIIFLGCVLGLASQLVILRNVISGSLIYYFGWDVSHMMLINLANWTIALGSITLFVTIVFAMVAGYQQNHLAWKGSWQGALVFVLCWSLMCGLFSYYVDHFQTYNPVYGALGGIILLLTWLYLSCFALIIGGEVATLIRDGTDRPKIT